MWRDPLDELIEDLERVVPADNPSNGWLTDMQYVVSSVLYPSAHRPWDNDLRIARGYDKFRRAFPSLGKQASTPPSEATIERSEESQPQCTGGAEEDVPHTRGCPLFGDSL